MSLEIGIVGLPNVGKSSLFNALTKSGAQASNFPFTTIEPNVGVVEVPDERLDFLADFFSSAKRVPATIKFVDIAGLIKGASKGEGLGNQFLSNIRTCDAIAEVVRCFEDPQIIHVAGKVDPDEDIKTINTELIISDLEQAERAKRSLQERVKRQDREAQQLLEQLEKASIILQSERPLRLEPELCKELVSYNFLTAKPLMYVVNVGDRVEQQWVEKVRQHANKEGAQLVVISVKSELEIIEMSPEEQAEFRRELGLNSGLDEVIKAGYELLNLQTFFTAGPKEAHAWTIAKGTRALQAAGKIHSDFERGFIRAQVYNVTDLQELKSESAIKQAGRLRSEGREYIVRDGDVIEFLFNV
jgi:GTP-binding protein YchF